MKYVIGSDEVGWGSWAGPLYVCAFAVPEGWTLSGLNDSKKLDRPDRAKLYDYLHKIPFALVRAGADCLDGFGRSATLIESHTLAVETMLRRYPDADVIVDGVVKLPRVPQARLVPKADGIYPAVMAASVVAKHSHDVEMLELHAQYPYYGWDTNMGYHSAKHVEGLAKHGVSPVHRRSYKPMRDM